MKEKDKQKKTVDPKTDKKGKKKLKLRWIIIPAIAVVLIGGALFWAWTYMQGQYVATVGNTQISKNVYSYFLNDMARQIEANQSITAGEAQNTFWNTTVQDDQMLEIRDKALENAANFQVQLLKAKKAMSLTTADKDSITTYIDNLISQITGTQYNSKTSGKDAKEKAIKTANDKIMSVYGLTLQQFTDIYTDQTLITNYAKTIKDTIKVSDADVKAYFEKNRATLEKVTVKHILIKTVNEENKPLSVSVVKAAKAKADDILAQLKNGADFAKLVTKYTEDTGSKDKGGEYTFKKGDMVPEFETWSFDAKRKAGELGIVKSTYGYHIMRFEKKQTFDLVKAEVKETLLNEKYQAIVAKWRDEKDYKLVKNKATLDATDLKMQTAQA